MRTIERVNFYDIEMQTLIDLIDSINPINSLGLLIFFSYFIIIA